ncbi:MAG: Arc family DNA-binding protein [Gemmatimonadota bacterium]
MLSLTIKNVPREVYRRLKELAAANRRSLNSEVIVRLEQSLGIRNLDPDDFLREVDELRESLNVTPVDDEALRTMKAGGRP